MDCLKVAVRVRPLLPKEKSSGLESQWLCTDSSITNKSSQSNYVFDRVFDEATTNLSVYKELASDIVLEAMKGFHGTLFTYGQSGSGKTFTIDSLRTFAINSIYEYIENCPSREFLMRVSYIELYNEKLVDLLAEETTALTIREDVDRNIYIDGLKEEIIVSQDHVSQVLSRGNERRRFAETKQNDRSSRAHCIFRIVIESREREDAENSSVYVSHLNLVDLAGSERAGENSGDRLREGCSINRSLLSLSLVIRKLSEGQSNTHISYRDSKLTRILQNALGGNSKTAILCTVSPSSVEETHSTLRFALNAKMVKNRPQQNEVLTDRAMLKKSQHEIERLKSIIKQLESGISSQEREELERQKERQNGLIEQLRSFLCVSSKVSTDRKIVDKKRRETVCVPQSGYHTYRITDLKDLSTVRIPTLTPKAKVEVKEKADTSNLTPATPLNLRLGISHHLDSPCLSADCLCKDTSFSEFEKAFLQESIFKKYRLQVEQLKRENRALKRKAQLSHRSHFVNTKRGHYEPVDSPGQEFSWPTFQGDGDNGQFGEELARDDSLLDIQSDGASIADSFLKPLKTKREEKRDEESCHASPRKHRYSMGRSDISILKPKPSRFSDVMEEDESEADDSGDGGDVIKDEGRLSQEIESSMEGFGKSEMSREEAREEFEIMVREMMAKVDKERQEVQDLQLRMAEERLQVDAMKEEVQSELSRLESERNSLKQERSQGQRSVEGRDDGDLAPERQNSGMARGDEFDDGPKVSEVYQDRDDITSFEEEKEVSLKLQKETLGDKKELETLRRELDRVIFERDALETMLMSRDRNSGQDRNEARNEEVKAQVKVEGDELASLKKKLEDLTRRYKEKRRMWERKFAELGLDRNTEANMMEVERLIWERKFELLEQKRKAEGDAMEEERQMWERKFVQLEQERKTEGDMMDTQTQDVEMSGECGEEADLCRVKQGVGVVCEELQGEGEMFGKAAYEERIFSLEKEVENLKRQRDEMVHKHLERENIAVEEKCRELGEEKEEVKKLEEKYVCCVCRGDENFSLRCHAAAQTDGREEMVAIETADIGQNMVVPTGGSEEQGGNRQVKEEMEREKEEMRRERKRLERMREDLEKQEENVERKIERFCELEEEKESIEEEWRLLKESQEDWRRERETQERKKGEVKSKEIGQDEVSSQKKALDQETDLGTKDDEDSSRTTVTSQHMQEEVNRLQLRCQQLEEDLRSSLSLSHQREKDVEAAKSHVAELENIIRGLRDVEMGNVRSSMTGGVPSPEKEIGVEIVTTGRESFEVSQGKNSSDLLAKILDLENQNSDLMITVSELENRNLEMKKKNVELLNRLKEGMMDADTATKKQMDTDINTESQADTATKKQMNTDINTESQADTEGRKEEVPHVKDLKKVLGELKTVKYLRIITESQADTEGLEEEVTDVKDLKKQLGEMERVNYLQKEHIEELEASHAQLKKQSEETEMVNSDLKAQLGILENGNTSLQRQNGELEEVNADLKIQIENVGIINSELKEQLKEMEPVNDDLKRQLKLLEDVNSHAKDANSELEKELEDMRATNSALQGHLQEERSKNLNLEGEVQETIATNSHLKEQLKETKWNNSELHGELQELELKISELREQLQATEERNSALEDLRREAESRNAGTETEVKEIENQNSQLKADMELLERKIAELIEMETENSQLKTDMELLERKIAEHSEMETENSQLKADMQLLESKNSELSEELRKMETTCVQLQEGVNLVENNNTKAKEMISKCQTRHIELRKRLTELEKINYNQDLQLMSQKHSISGLKKQLHHKEIAICEWKKQVKGMTIFTRELERDLSNKKIMQAYSHELENKVKEREENVAGLTSQTKDVEEDHSHLEKGLETARQEIERLQALICRGKAMLAEKSEAIKQTNRKAETLESELEFVTATLASREEELTKKTEEMDKLKQSLAEQSKHKQEMEELKQSLAEQSKKSMAEQTKQKREMEKLRKEVEDLENGRIGDRDYYENVIRRYKLKLREVQKDDASFMEQKPRQRPESSDLVSRQLAEFDQAAKLVQNKKPVEETKKQSQSHKAVQTETADSQDTVPQHRTGGAVETFVMAMQEREIKILKKKLEGQKERLAKLEKEMGTGSSQQSHPPQLSERRTVNTDQSTRPQIDRKLSETKGGSQGLEENMHLVKENQGHPL